MLCLHHTNTCSPTSECMGSAWYFLLRLSCSLNCGWRSSLSNVRYVSITVCVSLGPNQFILKSLLRCGNIWTDWSWNRFSSLMLNSHSSFTDQKQTQKKISVWLMLYSRELLIPWTFVKWNIQYTVNKTCNICSEMKIWWLSSKFYTFYGH